MNTIDHQSPHLHRTSQGTDTFVSGACPLDCPDGCSWIVTVRDGKAIGLRGTPDHPFTNGALCVKMNDYLSHVSAPDRLLYPLRRAGKKGEGRFARISWDEAIGEIATTLTDIIATYGGEAIWPYQGTGTMGWSMEAPERACGTCLGQVSITLRRSVPLQVALDQATPWGPAEGWTLKRCHTRS